MSSDINEQTLDGSALVLPADDARQDALPADDASQVVLPADAEPKIPKVESKNDFVFRRKWERLVYEHRYFMTKSLARATWIDTQYVISLSIVARKSPLHARS